MRRMALWLGVLGAVGCGPGRCEALGDEVVFSPWSGEHEGPDLVIRASWGDAELPGATLEVYADGVPVPGEPEIEDGGLLFRPDEPYPDDALVEAVVSWRCGGHDHSRRHELRTLPYIQPVAAPEQLAGAVFASPGGSFRVVAPDGDLGALVEQSLHMVWLPMIAVDPAEADGGLAASMVWANPFVPDEPTQRPCSLPVELPGATFSNPDLAVRADAIDIVTGAGLVSIYDLRLDGRIAQDGQRLGEVAFSARFDVRDLSGDFGYGDDWPAFCADAEELGHPCGRCPDNAWACLPVSIAGVEATRVDLEVEDEDVCGIDGKLALWSETGMYRAEPGGDVVERLDYTGRVEWSRTAPGAIVALRASTERDHTPRVIYGDGVSLWWRDLDPETGVVVGQGWVNTRMSVSELADLMMDVATGGCGAMCSTVPASRGGAGLLALSLVAIRRRKEVR